RLALAQDAVGKAADADATLARFLDVERRFGVFAKADLSPNLRAEFAGLLKRRLPAETLSSMPTLSAQLAPAPSTAPAQARRAPRPLRAPQRPPPGPRPGPPPAAPRRPPRPRRRLRRRRRRPSPWWTSRRRAGRLSRIRSV